jgi:hypothetical protein
LTASETRTARPTPGQAADVLRVAEARDGYPAGNIDGNTRAVLIGRRWVVALHYHAGGVQEVGAREWAAYLWVTPAGLAAARTAAAAPVNLSDRDAFALAEIEAAGPAGRVGFWPDTPQAQRVARCWGLTLFTPRSPTSGDYGTYRLTRAGIDALMRWRARLARPAVPTPNQARVLDVVDRLGIRPGNAETATHLCREFGWITRTGEQPRWLALTPAGRAAIAAYRTGIVRPPTRPPKPRTVTVRDLNDGDLCRLAHRRGWRNLTPEWVVFRRAQVAPPPGGGWQVWVDDGNGGERPYVDGPIDYRNRFEVKPPQPQPAQQEGPPA